MMKIPVVSRIYSFLVDSGASEHMVWKRKWIQDTREVNTSRVIMLGDCKRLFSTHLRTLTTQTFVGTSGDLHERIIMLKDVFFVPQLHFSHLSFKNF